MSEQKLTPEELKQKELDLAAYHFLNGSKRAKALAANMKAGGLARVFSMILDFPLVQGQVKRFRSEAENELFLLSLRVLEAKSKVVSGYKDQVLEGQEEALNTVKQELTQTKEETNGKEEV